MKNKLKKRVYIFCGLGGDERIFHRLKFSGYSTTFIKWLNPRDNEPIENYASRLLNQITTFRPVLIGLSFGGLIAIEVAKQIETEKVIIIASCKTRNEIPYYFRWIGKLGLHKLLPIRLLVRSTIFSNLFFLLVSTFDKQLLRKIMSKSDPLFLKWAIDKSINWTNQASLKNVIHIHGSTDHIFPSRFINCNFKIKNGGHFITLNNADELTKIIGTIIEKPENMS